MERQRERKPWREIDRGRDQSTHRKDADALRKHDEVARANAEVRQVRSALEALFAPKVEAPPAAEAARGAPRIVLPPSPAADPKHAERRRLLARLLAASGPGPITKVADDFLSAGFAFPDDQEVHMQLLEHQNAERVRDAVDALSRILAGELPKRKHVLDQRLRRIEEHAEDDLTRDSAAALRRLIHGRAQTPTPGRVR